jgi:sterol desaturase/sphingolipid hydroxylase (fatty acid hydroxylase superfamily)
MLLLKKIFNIEPGKLAYWADFALYSAANVFLILFLVLSQESIGATRLTALVLAGFLFWSFLEYVIHRFILHAVEPFKTWHALHHLRPRALIFAPTLFTGTLIGVLIFAPAYAFTSALPATAITLGFLIGYLGYALVHHAIHHWTINGRISGQLLSTRKRMHSLHHLLHLQQIPGNFGVTSAFWDRALGSHRGQYRVRN